MHTSNPVELRLLQALVMVADEGSVSAAADQLHIAQPSLSRQLRLLEQRLGLPLFERDGRRLKVTQVAEPVVGAARKALDAAANVLSVARQAAVGQVGRLAIAVLPGCSPVQLVSALARFRREHPIVAVSITELVDDDQWRELREGAIDVALNLIEPPPDDLCHQVVSAEQVCVVVPDEHRLAGKESVRFEDLEGEPLTFFNRTDQPVGYRWLTDRLRAAGVRATVQEATLTNIVATVAAGLAVSVMLRSFETILKPPGVRFIPIEDCAIDLIVTWRRGAVPAAVNAFKREL
ncbi:LysR family transcriptional regulator [Lentzea sp. NPDC003310]|uniref:LysR family transcriptional regulator n=1 Tax=Lentzea sp. NPDC003310 TaxID=3154447 RepID=UPI0033A6EFA2